MLSRQQQQQQQPKGRLLVKMGMEMTKMTTTMASWRSWRCTDSGPQQCRLRASLKVPLLDLRYGDIEQSSADRKKGQWKGATKKASKIVKTYQDKYSTHFSTFFRNFAPPQKSQNRPKVSKTFSTLVDHFHAAPIFRPLLGGSDIVIELEHIPVAPLNTPKNNDKRVRLRAPFL